MFLFLVLFLTPLGNNQLKEIQKEEKESQELLSKIDEMKAKYQKIIHNMILENEMK